MPFDGTEYTSSDPILKVIDRVAELICDEEHWWVPGRRNAVWGQCPVTAISKARSEQSAAPPHNEVRAYFSLAVPGPSNDVPAYNNADERTFPEIQALIAKARELRLADIMETADA